MNVLGKSTADTALRSAYHHSDVDGLMLRRTYDQMNAAFQLRAQRARTCCKQRDETGHARSRLYRRICHYTHADLERKSACDCASLVSVHATQDACLLAAPSCSRRRCPQGAENG